MRKLEYTQILACLTWNTNAPIFVVSIYTGWTFSSCSYGDFPLSFTELNWQSGAEFYRFFRNFGMSLESWIVLKNWPKKLARLKTAHSCFHCVTCYILRLHPFNYLRLLLTDQSVYRRQLEPFYKKHTLNFGTLRSTQLRASPLTRLRLFHYF